MDAKILDCCGLSCPVPIVQISKFMKTVADGEVVEVHATDLAFKADISAWCSRMGHELIEFIDGDEKIAKLRKL